jgi:hypothetical protein
MSVHTNHGGRRQRDRPTQSLRLLVNELVR